MKATGIVRKLDDLGRIVLPIEFRRTLDIAERDELEIYMENDQIILRFGQETGRLQWQKCVPGLHP